MLSITVAGFSSFPGVENNPTELLVEDFRLKPPSSDSAAIKFTFDVLKTQYLVAGEAVRSLLSALRPEFLLLLGVAEVRGLCLERFAVNIDQAPIADSSGEVRRGRRIVHDGPPAYETNVDVERLREYLVRGEIDAEISNHAGTYICNHTYYLALHSVRELALRTRVLFVHVPLFPRARLGELMIGGVVRALRNDVEALISHLIRC